MEADSSIDFMHQSNKFLAISVTKKLDHYNWADLDYTNSTGYWCFTPCVPAEFLDHIREYKRLLWSISASFDVYVYSVHHLSSFREQD